VANPSTPAARTICFFSVSLTADTAPQKKIRPLQPDFLVLHAAAGGSIGDPQGIIGKHVTVAFLFSHRDEFADVEDIGIDL